VKPPYPQELDEALKDGCHGKVATHEYAQILEDPTLTASFIRERLGSKLKWFEAHRAECTLRPGESWQDLVLRVVYKDNLGIEVSRDGVVVCAEKDLLIVDWQSWCPVLMYCAHKGQPTVPVCSVLYHMQFQYLLSLVLPGSFFTRDYSRIRPGASCCREIVFYQNHT
jgi:hypothetical protein